MAFSFLLLFGLVFLGGVIGLVLLLTSPATRAAAGTLLSLLGISLALLGLTMRGTSRRVAPVPHHAINRPMPLEETAVAAEAPAAEAPAADVRPAGEPTPAPDASTPVVTPPATPATTDSPAWLAGESRWRTRDEDAYWMRVRVGPYPREEPGLLGERPLPRKIEVHELRQMLDRDPLLQAMFQDAVDAAVAKYVDLLKPEPHVRVSLPSQAVLAMLVSDAWLSAAAPPDVIRLETSSSYDELVDLHVLLRFDADARRQLTALCRQEVLQGRVVLMGLGLGLLLAVMGLALTYLKTDLATQGAYRGRLRLAAAAVILGVLVAILLTVA